MSDRLTLVVFKDHLSSRTLTVRLAWLRAFGLALLSVIALAVVAGSLFLNAYRKTLSAGSVADSQRVAELEKELADATSSYESLKEQALSKAAGGSGALGGGVNSFASLPADAVLEALPTRESLPFRLENLKASWRGSILQIRSAIEYSREDGGNQQGHFILIARGPHSMIAYPENTFQSAGATTLMKPDSGEFFSVSRYREVKADFGPFAKREDVQNIEIYVFDPKKRLIYFDRIGIESGKTNAAAPAESTSTPAAHAAPKPVAKPKVAPAAPKELPTEEGASPVTPPPAATEGTPES